MIRRVTATTLVALAVWLAAPRGQQAGSPPAPYVGEEILVKFKPAVDAADRDNALARHAARLIRRFNALDLHHVRLPKGLSVEEAVAIFRAMPEVEFAQPNYLLHAVADTPTNDPYWLDDTLWGLRQIQVQSVWTSFGAGNGTVVVADIDTGLNYNHEDLAANAWQNTGEIADNGIDDDHDGYVDDVHGINVVNHTGNPMDDHGHGTHTAGTVAGVGNNNIGIVGVNWNAKILACKFLDASGSGSDAGAVECFNYVVGLKQRGVNIRVTSNSWGAPRQGQGDLALKSAIDAAGSANILNIFAAGNNGTSNDSAPFDPASFSSPSIVSVAASDTADGRAGFSNYGKTTVHLAAPGLGIVSTYGASYGSLSGTSMAAPHVAGTAALLSSLNPALTADNLKTLILANVDRLPQWTDVVVSGGRLNAYLAAAAAAVPNPPPTVSLTSPTAGATFTAPAAVTVSANASDGDGISSVAFYVNGAAIATDTTSPYSVIWSNVPAGTYSLTAVATDTMNASSTSSAVTITVSATANVPPNVVLTSPSAGATFTAPATVTVSANASDSDGISSVTFYANGTPIGTDTTSPYSVNWSNVAAGTYSLTAVATDTRNASSTSSAVSITVNPGGGRGPAKRRHGSTAAR